MRYIEETCEICGHGPEEHQQRTFSRHSFCFHQDPPIDGISLGCTCVDYIPGSRADVDLDLTTELST